MENITFPIRLRTGFSPKPLIKQINNRLNSKPAFFDPYKKMQSNDVLAIERLIEQLNGNKKYFHLGIPSSTLRTLLETERMHHRSQKELLRAVRQKLHNIIAPYLGDPDYPAATLMLDQAFQKGDALAIENACKDILTCHASTRERLPIAREFYGKLFDIIGKPQAIFDLACGLNPFMLPWMGLPEDVQYHAYDIHSPRVNLINHFFTLQDKSPMAEVRDVLINPPEVKADVAFLFKEAHRMEQRKRCCNRPMWEALQVKWLLVSLPANSLSGKRHLAEKHRRLVYRILEGESWDTRELLFENEMVFCIKKY